MEVGAGRRADADRRPRDRAARATCDDVPSGAERKPAAPDEESRTPRTVLSSTSHAGPREVVLR
ncbi:transglutaminase domain-containing protein, partial [Streptomyces sp. NPDC060198]